MSILYNIKMETNNDIFIPIPKIKRTNVKIEINNIDVTAYVEDSYFIKPSTTEIVGTFLILLKNAGERFSNQFIAGNSVKLYYDDSNGTTLQFYGRIDSPREQMSKSGKFIEIYGRHISYRANELTICYDANSEDPSNILINVINKYFPEFTTTNINLTGLIMTRTWVYVNFKDFILELCKYSGFDCRIDNSLDVHFFKSYSRFNSNEAITDLDNYISNQGYGIDNYFQKTRVVVIGQDLTGYPIIYTSKIVGETGEIREIKINDSNATTYEKAKTIGDANLTYYTNSTPQDVITSLGLVTLEAGEVMWVVVPRQGIYGKYRILMHRLIFGSKSSGIRSQVTIEKEFIDNSILLGQRITVENALNQNENINKLDYSYNFDFINENYTLSHTGTKIDNGTLILENETITEGTWISQSRITTTPITQIEMRYTGTALSNSKFYYSLDGGTTWIQITNFSTLLTPTISGITILIKVILIKSGNDTNPTLDGLVFFYS